MRKYLIQSRRIPAADAMRIELVEALRTEEEDARRFLDLVVGALQALCYQAGPSGLAHISRAELRSLGELSSADLASAATPDNMHIVASQALHSLSGGAAIAALPPLNSSDSNLSPSLSSGQGGRHQGDTRRPGRLRAASREGAGDDIDALEDDFETFFQQRRAIAKMADGGSDAAGAGDMGGVGDAAAYGMTAPLPEGVANAMSQLLKLANLTKAVSKAEGQPLKAVLREQRVGIAHARHPKAPKRSTSTTKLRYSPGTRTGRRKVRPTSQATCQQH